MRNPRLFGFCVAVLLLASGSVRADVVLDWNEHLLEAIRVDRTAPPRAARAMAVMHVSIFDAVNGITRSHTPYHVTSAAPAGASPEAAAVEAAYRALAALFPAQLSTFDTARTASLAAIPDGAARSAGLTWGGQVAEAILALRANDHATDVVDHQYPAGANWWTPTPPALAPALLPNWPTVTPWSVTRGDHFRAAAPPDPTSTEYADALREVLLLGRKDSTSRTAQQTEIALFWADGPGTATPPGHWLVIAQGLSASRGLSLAQNARLFALLSMTVADAGIVAWDCKYAFNNWRPITGIQNADTDGNPNTDADPAWTPLITTPPFPSYTSGHSTFSASSARLLAHFFGADEISFSTTSDDLPGVTRSFTSLSQAAEEAGQSRIYGGIHWQFDNQTALTMGRNLADEVFFNFLVPVTTPSTCIPGPATLCLAGGRFKVEANWNSGNSSGAGRADAQGADSGRFWFFGPDNTEVVIKVLDACTFNDRFWVFASGLTNVEVLVTVTDTKAGKARRYFNPRGKVFAPIQDVSAFATCP